MAACDNCECDISGEKAYVLTRGEGMQIWCGDCWYDLASEMEDEGWHCSDDSDSDSTDSFAEELIRGRRCASCGDGLQVQATVWGCAYYRRFGCDTAYCKACGLSGGDEWKCLTCVGEVIQDTDEDA